MASLLLLRLALLLLLPVVTAKPLSDDGCWGELKAGDDDFGGTGVIVPPTPATVAATLPLVRRENSSDLLGVAGREMGGSIGEVAAEEKLLLSETQGSWSVV